MSFRAFCDEMLLALYKEHQEGADIVMFGKVIAKYGIESQPGWPVRAHEYLESNGWISGPKNHRNDEMSAGRLTGPGMMHVEEELLTLDEDNLPEPFEELSGKFSALEFDPPDFDTDDEEPISFDSANWTGISARLSVEQKTKVRELTVSLLALIKQSDLDERSAKNASKHVEAIERLLEAPDPPWKAIVELLNHPAVMAFLAAKELIALIWSAAS